MSEQGKRVMSDLDEMVRSGSTISALQDSHVLNQAGITDWDCHEYRTGLPHGLPYGYVPRSDKIR